MVYQAMAFPTFLYSAVTFSKLKGTGKMQPASAKSTRSIGKISKPLSVFSSWPTSVARCTLQTLLDSLPDPWPGTRLLKQSLYSRDGQKERDEYALKVSFKKCNIATQFWKSLVHDHFNEKRSIQDAEWSWPETSPVRSLHKCSLTC